MKFKALISILLAAVVSGSGLAVAGPGDKGKGSVLIKHGNGTEAGYVEIDVSMPAALAHLGNHEEDCIVSATSIDLINDLAVALGVSARDLECDYIGEE